jgi:hypothetical protein
MAKIAELLTQAAEHLDRLTARLPRHYLTERGILYRKSEVNKVLLASRCYPEGALG